MKVALYARVSTEDQETEQQVKACRAYCEAKGWEIGIIILEKRSAWKGPRPEWEKLKAQLRARQWDGVVVFKIDRAWRRSSEFVLDFDEFNNRGIIVASVADGIDPSSPLGRALLNVIVALAEVERTALAESTKDRLRALKNLGKKLGRPMKNPVTDEIIYAKYQELNSIRGAAKELGVSPSKVHAVVHNPPPAYPSINGPGEVGGVR